MPFVNYTKIGRCSCPWYIFCDRLTVRKCRKDAIIVSYGLNQRSFNIQKNIQNDVIQYLVHHPTAVEPSNSNERKLLGYIRFDKKEGSLELTNFDAKLTPYNLELGGTTKSDNRAANKALAGLHGEGLKVAALVLVRNDWHSFQITSTSFYWTFGLRGINKTNLFCKLSRVPKKQAQEARNTSATLKGSPATDVSVFIKKAEGEKGRKISEEIFNDWIKVTLDIERPVDAADLIETEYGDLILDDSFAGNVYLKGLLLQRRGSYIKKMEAGYNLLDGKTNRDRERLRDENKEAEMLTNIWQQAIALDERVLQRYIDLLQDHDTCVDVTGAEVYVSETTAQAIWNRLRSQGDGKFYCWRKADDYQFAVIRKHLKRVPAPLSEKLWRVLRKRNLVRTPYEQCRHLFTNSSSTEEPSTSFSTNIQRGLEASLGLDIFTRGVEVEYVSGAGTDIDMLFDKEQQLLKIHEKWLNFTKVHQTAPCGISKISNVQSPDSDFCCDHVIEEIYDLAANEIIQSLELPQADATILLRSMRLKVRENLQQMPRNISVVPSNEPGQLIYTWTNGESELVQKALGTSSTYCVTLHQERTCSQKRSKYLHEAHLEDTSAGQRECKSIDEMCENCLVATSASRRAVFMQLDPGERYFPMIARAEDYSIYGIPPEGRSPIYPPSEVQRISAQVSGRLRDIPPITRTDSSYIVISDHESEDEPAMMIEEHNEEQYLQRNDTCGTESVTARASSIPSLAGTELRPSLTDRTRSSENARAQWEHAQEQKWSSWEKENLQSSFDQFFSSRNLSVRPEISFWIIYIY